ncbi:MAG: phosphotransferase [Ktedonobacterales bacterium]|nr:phosphotransferase [Ktedonobacterales bacterium]
MPIPSIPARFAHTITDVHGAAGRAWLERLPGLLADGAARWGLTLGPPFPHLSYNYAAPAMRADGTEVVVKVGYPGEQLTREAEALRLFDGEGAARLLMADLAWGALVLERLAPGTPLRTVRDDERAITIAASVLRQLWRPVPAQHPFPAVADWAADLRQLRQCFGGTSGPFPAALVDEAERLFAELGDSMAAPALLHGDLNFGNVLAAGRAPWLAIDPKGLIGEPAYDTGILLRDPLPDLLTMPHPRRILARRIDQLAAELGFARARVRGWGLAQAVLSAWWHFEDHGQGWEPALACAALLAEIVMYPVAALEDARLGQQLA